MSRLLYTTILLAFAAALPCIAQTSPAIEVEYISPWGYGAGVEGRVTGVDPSQFRLARLGFVSGRGFFTIPIQCVFTTMMLDAQGRFYAHFEYDHGATLIVLLVVPASFPVPCYSSEPGLPAELESAAVAKLVLRRPNPNEREIVFAGQTWTVKKSLVRVGPGNNMFSDSADNIFVDAQGRLHLRITKRDGVWQAAEVISKRPVTYGRYSVRLDSLPALDRNVVFGAFTWTDADRKARELDLLEIGMFGRASDGTNAQYVVQPWNVTGNLMRIALPPIAPTTHTMDWTAGEVRFASTNTLGTKLAEWTYAGSAVPLADSDQTRFRLNLWLLAPPTNDQEAEVIISDVSLPVVDEQRPASLSPSTGSGMSQTFTAVFRHPGGQSQHYLGYMLFLPLPNVVSFNAQGTCLIEYNRLGGNFDGRGGMRLINNAGTDWLGPIQGVPLALSTPALSNNACTVNVAGATATFAGTDMIVTAPVTFHTPQVTQTMATFIQSNDVTGQWSDFRQFGNWIVAGAPTRSGPFIVSGMPAAGQGNAATFTFSAGHTAGLNQLGEIHIRINTAIVGGAPCHVIYSPVANVMSMINDAGTALVGPVAVGQPLTTGRCSVAAGASRSVAGNSVVLTLPLQFNPGLFGTGTKNVYLNGFDITGAVTHWVQTGTWTVQ